LSSASANSLLVKGALLAALLGCSSLHAQFVWNGGGGNSNMGTNANWVGGTAPARGAGADLQFAGSTRTSPVTNGSTWTINSITFNSGAAAFTISNTNAITLGASGVNSVVNSSTNLQTISSNITLAGGAQSWSANSGDLTFGGTINNGGFGLTLNGGHNFILSNTLSGAGALTVNDAGGAVTLSGANTYSGGTTVTAATLNLNNATALGTGTFTVNSTNTNLGAGLTVAAANSGANSINNTTNLTASGTVTNSGTGSLTFANVNLSNTNTAQTLTIGGSGATSITGTIANGGTGASNLLYSGTGTLTLSGANTYSGTTTLNTGTGTLIANNNAAFGSSTLVLAGAGATLKSTTGTTVLNNIVTLQASTNIQDITFNGTVTETGGSYTITNNGTSLTFSNTAIVNLSNTVAVRTLTLAGSGATIVNGLIQNGPGTGSLLLLGPGSVTLSNSNLYTGGTTLTAGTLNINNNSALGTGTFTINGGTIDSTIANITLNNNAQTWGNVGAGSFTFDGTNNDLNLGTGAVTLKRSMTVTTNGTHNLTVGGIIGGGFGLTKAGAATLTLSGANTYTAGTTIQSGTLDIGTNTSLGTGAVTFNTGNSTLQAGATLSGVTNAMSVATGITATMDTQANSMTLSGVISGAGALTKTGTGTLTLANTNSYSGGTTLNAGILDINTAGALGTGTFIINGGTIGNTSGAAIASVGNAQTWNGSFTFNGTNANQALTFTNNVALTATPTVTVSNANGTLTENGIISGAGFGLTKAGAGTLVLGSATGNTYNGGTIINDGTITAGANAALGTGGLVVNDTTAGGTANFNLNGHTQAVSSLTLGGAGDTSTSTNNVTLGAGTLTLGGNVTYDATNNPLGSTISGGTLALGASRTFTVGSSSSSSGSDLTVSSVISGGAGVGLTKAGNGNLVLSSATGNTYGGDTIINGGTITAGANAALGTGAGNLVVNDTSAGGTANFNLGNNTQTVNSLTFGGAGDTSTSTNNVTIGSTGQLNLGGSVTYDATNNPLGSTISGGTLALGTADRTFTVNSSGSSGGNDLTISSAISSTGAFGLIKAGTGNLTLSGANTFTGATAINAGKLTAGATNILNTSSGVTVASGATLNLNGNAQTITNLNVLSGGTLTYAGGEALTLVGNSNFLGGTLTSGAGTHTLTIGLNAVLTFNASFTDNNLNIILAGGTLMLNGTTDVFGSLTVTAASTIDFAPAANSSLTVSSVSDSSFQLSISDWSDEKDYFKTTNNTYTQGSVPLDQIVFSGFGTTGPSDPTKWLAFDNEITPVPEPATYGAIFTAATLGLFFWFRLKTKAPRLAPVRVAVQY
jgi:fibronectin-binding autotransporter adhesin